MAVKPKQVHFILGAHGRGDLFSRRKAPYSETKTVLIEESRGMPVGTRLEKYPLKNPNSPFAKSLQAYMEEARKRGISVEVGEATRNYHEESKLDYLNTRQERSFDVYNQNKKYSNFVSYMLCFGKLKRFRHALIKRSIKSALKRGNVEARYGTNHNDLRRDLIREGIPASREVHDIINSTSAQILTKLSRGIKPTEIELKRAYAERLLDDAFQQATPFQKTVETPTNYREVYYENVLNTLAKRITPTQLNEIARTGDVQPALVAQGLKVPRTEAERKHVLARIHQILNSTPGWRNRKRLLKKFRHAEKKALQ